jgi:hypothetical protein
MKKWTCLKCGKETDRRQGLCNDKDEHEWIDSREYLEAVAAEKARQKRMAEERRQKATAEYQSFLNSAEGKERHVAIVNGYMARRRTASIWSLVLGIITILALPFGCASLAYSFDAKSLQELGQWIPDIAGLLGMSELLTAIIAVVISCLLVYGFYKSLEKRSNVIPQVRSLETGRTIPIMDAAKFVASRDISQNFPYEDENGYSCVPEPFVPDTSDTETEWQEKMKHAGKLVRREKWAEAADEYRKIGNECGFTTISAPAWGMAALCYKILRDERTLACYNNAVRGYKKLANQGHEGAQEKLAEVERDLAEFLNPNAQAGNE